MVWPIMLAMPIYILPCGSDVAPFRARFRVSRRRGNRLAAFARRTQPSLHRSHPAAACLHDYSRRELRRARPRDSAPFSAVRLEKGTSFNGGCSSLEAHLGPPVRSDSLSSNRRLCNLRSRKEESRLLWQAALQFDFWWEYFIICLALCRY